MEAPPHCFYESRESIFDSNVFACYIIEERGFSACTEVYCTSLQWHHPRRAQHNLQCVTSAMILFVQLQYYGTRGLIKKIWFHCNHFLFWNKANLRDFIAATCLVILLKLDSNRRFFSLYDLEISWMISTNYGAPLLRYIKLCASCQTRRWIQTGVTVWKRSILVKIGDFFVPCDLAIWRRDDLEKQ